MTCNFSDLICVRFIVFVANGFLWFFRVVILPFCPCQLLRKVWGLISCVVFCCFGAVKSVVNEICSFLFGIWMRYIAGPTVEAIRCVITRFIYWGYHVVKAFFVYLVTQIFNDLYKLALIVFAKYKEMGISDKIYEYVVGTVTKIMSKIFEYLTGNQGVKNFVTQIISGSVTGAKDLVSQSITGTVSNVKNDVTGYLSDKVTSITKYIPFMKNNSDASKKSDDEHHGDEEVVENVAKVSAERKLLNALPDNIQKSIEKCKSTIKETFEEPESSVQAKIKSSLKQNLSRNSPTKKTL